MLRPYKMTQIDDLIEININAMAEAIGLTDLRRGRRILEWLFGVPARAFAELVAGFDGEVGRLGLQGGSQGIIKQVTRKLEAAGRDHIPADGPILILSNHPGMADTVALFSAIARPDLRVIASDRPFLRALPNVSDRMIYVPTDESDRMSVVRNAVKHLKSGGTALTFPAGQIEPDPLAHGAAGAIESLGTWSPSIAVFARLAPQTKIIPAIVSGVVSAEAGRSPLTRIRRGQKDRERMAAALQIMLPRYQAVTARVAFGLPFLAADLIAANTDPLAAITDAARHLIESPPTEWETIVIGDR